MGSKIFVPLIDNLVRTNLMVLAPNKSNLRNECFHQLVSVSRLRTNIYGFIQLGKNYLIPRHFPSALIYVGNKAISEYQRRFHDFRYIGAIICTEIDILMPHANTTRSSSRFVSEWPLIEPMTPYFSFQRTALLNYRPGW